MHYDDDVNDEIGRDCWSSRWLGDDIDDGNDVDNDDDDDDDDGCNLLEYN